MTRCLVSFLFVKRSVQVNPPFRTIKGMETEHQDVSKAGSRRNGVLRS
ncbi:hypothetical protein JOC94_002443 [Bacillus thermophilus]|uniref:Uncharacterized protein n=1 Tax=Siminovitchia thermophila TaxID=1245522 RepID=A0ABS2RA11_9BACI|nr:hypothetical protein [Siminovitchia thermophila]MBM7715456.1 hypothetical protein [Siminovitchia thermophila]